MLVMIDLDNTLADRAWSIRSWASQFATERGLPGSAIEWIIEIDNDGYSNRREVIATIVRRFGLSDEIDDLLARYQTEIIELARPVVGAAAFLRDLRSQDSRIAIVTNGSTKQQNAKIDRLAFRPLVDAVVVSETIGIKKPDPRIYEAAAEATAASLGGAWMVGDSPTHDISGATQLGLRTAWLSRGRRWNTELASPDITVENLSGLASQIGSHPA